MGSATASPCLPPCRPVRGVGRFGHRNRWVGGFGRRLHGGRAGPGDRQDKGKAKDQAATEVVAARQDGTSDGQAWNALRQGSPPGSAGPGWNAPGAVSLVCRRSEGLHRLVPDCWPGLGIGRRYGRLQRRREGLEVVAIVAHLASSAAMAFSLFFTSDIRQAIVPSLTPRTCLPRPGSSLRPAQGRPYHAIRASGAASPETASPARALGGKLVLPGQFPVSPAGMRPVAGDLATRRSLARHSRQPGKARW